MGKLHFLSHSDECHGWFRRGIQSIRKLYQRAGFCVSGVELMINWVTHCLGSPVPGVAQLARVSRPGPQIISRPDDQSHAERCELTNL